MNGDPESLKNYNATECLLDGREILIRAIRPEDKSALRRGLQRLTPESAYFRFFQPKQDLSKDELAYLTEPDFIQHVALLAILVDNNNDVTGGARYIVYQTEPHLSAELTFTVNDEYHGLGIATHLLRHMITVAQSANIKELHARVLPDNQKMLSVFSKSGIPHERSMEDGVVNFIFVIEDSSTTTAPPR